jgi:hypothetical protein
VAEDIYMVTINAAASILISQHNKIYRDLLEKSPQGPKLGVTKKHSSLRGTTNAESFQPAVRDDVLPSILFACDQGPTHQHHGVELRPRKPSAVVDQLEVFDCLPVCRQRSRLVLVRRAACPTYYNTLRLRVPLVPEIVREGTQTVIHKQEFRLIVYTILSHPSSTFSPY